MNNIKYLILPSSEVENINFSQVLQTSAETIRYNNEQTKFILKYINTESAPDIISEALTINGRTIHSHSEILEILSTDEWIYNEE